MLEAVEVVELQGSVAGGYAAKLLADRGAKVTVVTNPERPPAWSSGMSRYLNSAKTVTPETDDGRRAALVAGADVVIESSSPDPLVSLSDRVPDDGARIALAISPFGNSGPRAHYRSTDLTDQAVSGHLYLNGDPDREPLQGPDHQVAYAAGGHGAIGVLAALRARSINGRGQRVEISHHEVMTALHQFTLLRYTHNGDIVTRMGNRYAGPGRPAGVYHCGDGLISLIAPRGDQLETLLSIAGLDHLLERPDIASVYDLMHHPSLLDEHLAPWLAGQDLADTVELLQAVRIPAAEVSTMSDLLADQHLRARGFWTPIGNNDSGVPLEAPGSPITITRPINSPITSAAPQPESRSESESADGSGSLASGPLTGLRVLDLTRVWAGPYGTRILADLGADVIMIEAPWARGPSTIDRTSVMATRYYPDNEPGERHWNRIGFSNKYNINKRNLALDLNKPDGLAVLKRLITEADVLIENYSPRVMPQFGLGEEQLHELNPSLVYVTMPGFGRSGPSRDHVAYGPIVDSQAGLSVLMGYDGETARKAGVAWPDPVAGMHAALATVAALLDRATDRVGRTVEVAQIEATIAMAGHAVVDRQLTGDEPRPIGNRHAGHAPHGVYRCQGEDRWLAIAVVDDASWHGLCATAGFTEDWWSWTASQRQVAHDEIDDAIERWSLAGEAVTLMEQLQAAGVPATEVADAAAVMADEQHRARDFFVELTHPEAGRHRWPRLPINLAATPASYRRPGPNLNQDAVEILSGLAGMDAAAIATLYRSGATADRPPD